MTHKLSSEVDFLDCIDRHFPNSHPHLIVGRGDDCAVLSCPERICLSSDLFLEDIHFREQYFSPADIGHKALAVSLSDIAASGAVPLGFTLDLMVPEGRNQVYWDEFFNGMASLAQQYNVPLAGGDLSKSPILGTSVTIWGAPTRAAGGTPVFLNRTGCSEGDIIFLIGTIGLARTGLNALETIGRNAMEEYPAATNAHLRPMPQIEAGQILSGYSSITLMDLSDGLARDIPRLLGEKTASSADKPSTKGASINITTDMLHAEQLSYAQKHNLDPVFEAFKGGEDYALLGTCPASIFAELVVKLPQMQKLGIVTSNGQIVVNGQATTEHGFDHFA
ncbi:thiamine-phosphate kinase [Halodesulfovibrio marinisediminis]|uniref:Thiamine-monophosphate kinase n=1 Tax=Halodesulfovibrio marinisediminis DSM 17456 TaxID=1121457 RepID=A0A1N6J4C3_9BACT|nr:thiamine-phosphate kinase [Halodesulfovibrio marinisediminis]SIO39150.1 thiamine-phosphate kinase [Halodesulfovibrio marinisediminis DSM 17456]